MAALRWASDRLFARLESADGPDATARLGRLLELSIPYPRPRPAATSTCCGSRCGRSCCARPSGSARSRTSRSGGVRSSSTSSATACSSGEFSPGRRGRHRRRAADRARRRARLRDRRRLPLEHRRADALAAGGVRRRAARDRPPARWTTPWSGRDRHRRDRRPPRIGGHVVAESLAALGAEVAFGVPGIHSLAIWEALRTSEIDVYGTRTELCAGFAADGYARSSGRPAPLLLSTGPGALNSLTALMEAASAHVPVVAISSQIPSEMVGRGRGYLHETADQLASFRPLVKHAARAESADVDPGPAGRGLARGAHAPHRAGVPRDPGRPARGARPGHAPVTGLTAAPERHAATPEAVDAAAALLEHAERPVIWAGGGVLRAGAGAGAARARRAAAGPGGHHLHGQGGAPRRASAGRRLRMRRGRPAGAAVRRRRRPVRRHRAGRRDHRPVRAALRRPPDPPRRRTRPASAPPTRRCRWSATPS